MARRQKHNLSSLNLCTGEMGTLMPIQVLEVLPGDTVECQSKALIRVTPLAAPVYHSVTARIHHWNIPNRIVADRDGKAWEEFITGGVDGMNTDIIPQITSTGTSNDLLDYMGIEDVAGVDINAYPIRGFNKVFNEFYRDQDTVPERLEDDITIPNIAWQKDYFTTSRPFSQRGPSISIPIGDKAPVTTDADVLGAMSVTSTTEGERKIQDSSGPFVTLDSGSGTAMNELYADLTEATGIDAIEFREFFALQRFAEARARFGARYTEYMRYIGSNYKGTLNRPEYLGGGTTTVNFSEVLQTSPDVTGPEERHEFGVGDLYGHGIASMRSNKFRRTIDEHGYVLSLLSVRPKAIYTNGVERHWLKKDREDYFQKELEAIGQQEILDNELKLDPGNDQAVFGFQDRYSEYKWARSHATTEFRNLLDYWHMGRVFDTQPVLNQSFTDCVPTKRIYNEQTTHPLWIMTHNRTVARRVVGKSGASRLM